MGLQALFGLEAVVVDVPLAALHPDRVPDGGRRRRADPARSWATVPRSCWRFPGRCRLAAATGRDRAPETLEDLAAEILGAVKLLGPEHADCLAVVELAPVAAVDVQPLDDVLAPLWNTARYFDATGLLVAADGPAELGDSAADAVIAWAGAAPAGAGRAGRAPRWRPDRHPGGAELPALPGGGFYTTRGELPADHRHRLAAHASSPQSGAQQLSSASVLDATASDAERSFELYRELLQVPSVWGDARELRRAADLLGGALSDAGLDVQLPDSGTPEMPMLLARLPGRAGGPALLLAGHMEVYPPSQSWTLDPWDGDSPRWPRVRTGLGRHEGRHRRPCARPPPCSAAPAPSCPATSSCSRSRTTSKAARGLARRSATDCARRRQSSASQPTWRW